MIESTGAVRMNRRIGRLIYMPEDVHSARAAHLAPE